MVVSDDDEEQQHAWEEENASQEDPIQLPWIIRFPLRLTTASVGFSLRLIRPYTTQLIPLVQRFFQFIARRTGRCFGV